MQEYQCALLSRAGNDPRVKGQLADSIMSNNNVYDMDGSDQMASYLYVSARLDTLLAK